MSIYSGYRTRFPPHTDELTDRHSRMWFTVLGGKGRDKGHDAKGITGGGLTLCRCTVTLLYEILRIDSVGHQILQHLRCVTHRKVSGSHL